MTSDNVEFFDAPTADQTPSKAEAAPVQPATPEAAPTPAQPAPDKPLETPPAEQPAAKETPTVPLPKYLDTYHENRELKRQLAEFNAKKDAPQPPDPVANPKEFAEFQNQETKNEILDLKVQMSETMARQVYGEALVKEAFAALYAKGDQYIAAQALKSAHPADEVVKWYKREKLLNDIGDNPDEFVKRRFAELNAAQPPAIPGATPPPAITPNPPPNVPPPSLSRAPSSGSKPSDTVASDGFETAFTR